MVRFGEGCKKFLDREMRDLTLKHIELDEIWTYCKKKDKKLADDDPDVLDAGSIFVYVALDQHTRLIPAFRVGKRDQINTNVFIYDLANRLRIPKPHQSDDHAFVKGEFKPIVRISTDGFRPYESAIDNFLGQYAIYGQVVKKHNATKPEDFIRRKVISGEVAELKDITTSLVERNNLTTRTMLRRFTRRTLSFSKKIENLRAAVAMHFANYNYCWVLRTLKTTPAVAAGIADKRFRFNRLYSEIRDSWPELFVSEKGVIL